MNKSILLVDYENVGRIDLSSIPGDTTVILFFGAAQKSVPTELLKSALKLRERFVPVDIEGQGRNALDFHIAFYLGEIFARHPDSSCEILSKDKGFDALIKHLNGRKLAVRRIEQIGTTPAPTKPKAPAKKSKVVTKNPIMIEAYEWLKKTQKEKRPRKLESLITHLHTHCGKKLPATEIKAFVEQMIAAEELSAAKNGTISYHF